MAIMDELKRMRWRMVRRIRSLHTFARVELRDGPASGLPLAKRAKWVLRGFLSQSVQLYSLNEDNWRDYVSSYTSLVRCGININNINRSRATFDNKVRFADWCSSNKILTPAVMSVVQPETLYMTNMQSILDGPIGDALQENAKLIIKPLSGMKGRDISLLEYVNGTLYVNGHAWVKGEKAALINEPCIISRFVEQHSYARKIFPKAANTIRILTLWDDETDSPIIAAAAHRFGTERSIPVDNWARGGITAWIDVESGIMSTAASRGFNYVKEEHYNHPDNQCPIAGVVVPNWAYVREVARDLAARSHEIGNDYVGWDILMTDDGVCIIEANTNPDLDVFQAHRPLYSIPEIRQFFERRAVL